MTNQPKDAQEVLEMIANGWTLKTSLSSRVAYLQRDSPAGYRRVEWSTMESLFHREWIERVEAIRDRCAVQSWDMTVEAQEHLRRLRNETEQKERAS